MSTYRQKLIEVNLPLDVINPIAAKEKRGSRPGHPSTLHRYWARRPLASCRAVIFASMVDDPIACPDEFLTEADRNAERNRLHSILRQLVLWENTNNENLLTKARQEIARSIARNNGTEAPTDATEVLEYLREHAPAIYDPFCGGGSIPLEAQRLGLCAQGSDLNPLPVLITKAMVELPNLFRNISPVNLKAQQSRRIVQETKWSGTAGLADDIRYYGAWMREEAHKHVGHLYPKVQLLDGTAATVVAWLWARTVPCINPVCGLQMPLMTTFQLSKKKGNEYWTKPVIDRGSNTLSFVVQPHNDGVPHRGTTNRTGAYCCACGTAVRSNYIREQAKAGKMGELMTAIVAEGKPKMFVSPTESHIQVAMSAKALRKPQQAMPNNPTLVSGRGYGITHWHQLFTERQLTMLNILSNLLTEVRKRIVKDGAENKYADAICTYLALAIGRTAESGCKAAWWQNTATMVAPTFTRQALQMTWAFAEVNPFSTSTQNWIAQVEWVANVVNRLPAFANSGEVYQADACTTTYAKEKPVIVTDPPYYDNIHYADLSDFFYVWIRPILRDIYPDLLSGMLTPKEEEIVAIPSRFENSPRRFEELLSKALLRMRQHCSDEFPSSIFYAYKQQEEEQNGRTSTGWETMLTAIVNAGFQLVSTWPLRTEHTTGTKTRKNALASSILLVCRPRPENAPVVVRSDFLQELKKTMPPALDRLTRIANIRPVDLAQAAIGPGMEVYSRYSKVVRISGAIMSIREVLKEINNEITAYHEKETGEMDPESQFCLIWMQQHGYTAGNFGDADVLSKAKGVDIATMQDKVLIAARGKVRLLKMEEYAERDNSDEMTAWEGCLRMVWHLSGLGRSGGISGCTAVARAMRDYESAKHLAHILYTYYERRGDAESASHYNNLVTQWQYIWESMGSPEQMKIDTTS